MKFHLSQPVTACQGKVEKEIHQERQLFGTSGIGTLLPGTISSSGGRSSIFTRSILPPLQLGGQYSEQLGTYGILSHCISKSFPGTTVELIWNPINILWIDEVMCHHNVGLCGVSARINYIIGSRTQCVMPWYKLRI